MVIDPGLFTGQFEDAVDSVGEFVDLVKFGWGTCLVTKDIKRKIDILRGAGIAFHFGGTLFERYALDGLVSEWLALCRVLGTTHVEVSNGTIPITNTEKARWVARLTGEFVVISEVGFKDIRRSDALTPALDRLLFEAPNSGLQTYFLRRMGPSVNIGNVRADDVIALETLRRGLRSDTLLETM